MNVRKKISLASTMFLAVTGFAQIKTSIPHLTKINGIEQLVVNDKPFLSLGGETGNSSTSTAEYMRPHWAKLKAMHLNTVVAPVYWELMEPTEGKFDFALVDSMLFNARKQEMKLVLLWFGTWKNSMSCYAPAWVKKDVARFERATTQDGKRHEILSAFSQATLTADIKAFTALMAHLKQLDQKQQTVIMIQVENEIGMLGDAREYTDNANKAFAEEIPATLSTYMQKNRNTVMSELKKVWDDAGGKSSGSWQQIFGTGTDADEIFQAWYYARFAGQVAAAGKKMYNLPMYVNAALNHRNAKPGVYPSAGPLPHLMDIWKAAAPDIDILSPDFYNPRFKYYNDLYVRAGNPLFIPEIHFDSSVGAKAMFAVGHYHAMGFSPFSIESLSPGAEPLAQAYKLLEQLWPTMQNATANGKIMEGFLLDKANPVDSIQIGKYKVKVSHEHTLSWSSGAKDSTWPVVGSLIIQLSDDEFYIAGSGSVFTFTTNSPSAVTGILQSDEGYFRNGIWHVTRRMNGDQTHQGRHVRIESDEWSIQKVKLYEY